MKPVAEVRQETAEVLGSAVAEVARRAIRPELDPFKQSLESLVGSLEGHAETLDEQVRAERKALDGVNKQLGEVISAGKGQAAAAAETQTRVQELRERLDALASELARTRDEHATTVAALNALRDEVLEWMRTSSRQTEQLASILGRAEALADGLENQASAFADLGDALHSRIDARTNDVLQSVVQARAERSREISDLKSVLENGFKGQNTSSRSATNDVLTKLDAGVKVVTGALATARQAGSSEIAALGAASQARQDAAIADVRSLVGDLRADLATKGDFLQAINKLESGNHRSSNDIAGLRTTVEKEFASLRTELGAVLDRLSARHEDHGRELAKTGHAAGRVFRLSVANLILGIIALSLGGIALWMSAR